MSEQTALMKFEKYREELENESALERLRFFCSLAMNGRDWLDVEEFFIVLEEVFRIVELQARAAEDVIAHLLRVHENRDLDTSRTLARQMLDASSLNHESDSARDPG